MGSSIESRNELIPMIRAFNSYLNRFAVAALEKIYSRNREYFMSPANNESSKIQSDEASSSEMEHTCKHEQRREDTKRRKTQAVKLKRPPSSIEKRFGNLQKHRPQKWKENRRVKSIS
ncbi:hypothetical protein BD560DRAFT_426761 [Blakeslea trispora]|nr:hypothetical protein BD560DRAFT_429424 [Blakeslea trispora]KAI8354636.1 hypothetical protein BD560DRAFT_426761 [Blakeslea trispora]